MQPRAALAASTRKHLTARLRAPAAVLADQIPARLVKPAVITAVVALVVAATAMTVVPVLKASSSFATRLASHSLLGTAHFPSQASRSAWKRAAGSQQTMVSLASLVVLSALSTIDG